jgi:hypothetical protein
LYKEGTGVRYPTEAKFLFSTALRPAMMPTKHLAPRVPGIKRQGREADRLPPSSAEVKNAWSYTSTPSVHFRVKKSARELYRPSDRRFSAKFVDRLYGLVVRVPGYRSRGPGTIPGATRFSEK